ncbi:MAG: helix-turn-helix domain-containing protein [Microcoleaceae cyanobacterium]
MPMKMKTDISYLVATMRQRLGISQEKLAAELGVSFQTVNRWERGHTKPSHLALTAIKNKLISMGNAGHDLLSEYFEEEA